MKNQLAKAKKIASTKTSISATSLALVTEDTITVTNLEVYYTFKHDWNVIGRGLIPFDKLLGSFDKLKSFDGIEFMGYGSKSIITSGKTTLKFDANETIDMFPSKNIGEVKHKGTINFDNKFKTAQKFTGKDELRPVMSGVLFDKEYIVSTDAHKLYWEKHNNNINGDMIIPSTAFIMDGEFEYQAGECFVEFKNNTETFVVRLIDGRYPPYMNVIPTDNPNSITLGKPELVKGLGVLSLAYNQHTRTVALQENGMYAEDIDMGTKADYQMEMKINKGECIRIGMNAGFLELILSQIKEDEIVIENSIPTKAMIINGKFLLMPVDLTK